MERITPDASEAGSRGSHGPRGSRESRAPQSAPERSPHPHPHPYPAPVSGSAAPGLVVSSLWRDDSPDLRAAHAERNLIRTVAEWEPGAGVDLLLWREGGERVRLDIRAIGEADPNWQADVRIALTGIAELGRTSAARRPIVPAQLAELVRDPARSIIPAGESAEEPRPVDPNAPRLRTAPSTAPSVALPIPRRDAAVPLLSTLRSLPGGFVRVLIASPSDLERTMLNEELLAAWSRSDHPAFDDYLGSPVRIRTFIGTKAFDAGIAPLSAAVRGWGSALSLRACDATEHLEFTELCSGSTAGHVRPEAWASALLRLPASGPAPIVGMPSRPRPIAAHPMQATPNRSDRSLAFGHGRSISGRKSAATLEVDDLLRHLLVTGRSGTGKSNALVTIIAELSRLDIGFTLLDHHGTSVDAALEVLAPGAAATVIRPTSPAGLNLLDEEDPNVLEQSSNEFIDLIQAIFDPRGEGIVGPRWRRWFSLLREGVSAMWGRDATLLHLLSVGADPARVGKLSRAIQKKAPDLAHRLQTEIAGLSGDEASNLTAWTMAKFQPMVSQRATREIFGQPRDAVNVSRLLDDGGSLLLDLGGTVLGTATAQILGALWIMKHQIAMGRRRDRSRPHILIVDEAHLYTFGALPTLLAEARKFGLGVIIATQSLAKMTPAMQSAIEANVSSEFAFRLGRDSVADTSFRLGGWPAQELIALPDLHAAASVTRRGVPQDPFLVSMPYAAPAHQDARIRAAAIEARCAERWRARAVPAVVTDREVESALTQADPRARAMQERAGQMRPGQPRPWQQFPGQQRPKPPADRPPVPKATSAEPSFIENWLSQQENAREQTPTDARGQVPTDAREQTAADPREQAPTDRSSGAAVSEGSPR